jgi:hypothetical protein
MKSFLLNLNTRLLVIHFIAFLFFMYGFQILAFLHDYGFLYYAHMKVVDLPHRLDFDMTIIEQSGNIGLIVAFILSYIISARNGWNWVNSVVVFLLTFLIENLIFLKWTRFHDFYLSPGGLFNVYSKGGHFVLGLILISIGVLLIFLKRIVRYISYDTMKDRNLAVAHRIAAKKGRK